MSKKVIIFAQLGSPESSEIRDVRVYLKEFLSNPLVVPINRLLWKIVLNLFVLPFRSPKSAKRYQKVWNGEEFLLKENSRKLVEKIRESGVQAELAYVIGNPSLKETLDKYQNESCVVVPLFPQESKSTTGLVEEIIGDRRVELLRSFHDRDFYIDSCVRKIEEGMKGSSSLILSFHSVPIKGNDLYIKQCVETFVLIRQKLKVADVRLGFQSKFGKGKWVGPLLEELLRDQHEGKVAIFCPGFLVDCLETRLEIGEELKEEFPNIEYISCLNDSNFFVDSFKRELGVITPSS